MLKVDPITGAVTYTTPGGWGLDGAVLAYDPMIGLANMMTVLANGEQSRKPGRYVPDAILNFMLTVNPTTLFMVDVRRVEVNVSSGRAAGAKVDTGNEAAMLALAQAATPRNLSPLLGYGIEATMKHVEDGVANNEMVSAYYSLAQTIISDLLNEPHPDSSIFRVLERAVSVSGDIFQRSEAVGPYMLAPSQLYQYNSVWDASSGFIRDSAHVGLSNYLIALDYGSWDTRLINVDPKDPALQGHDVKSRLGMIMYEREVANRLVTVALLYKLQPLRYALEMYWPYLETLPKSPTAIGYTQVLSELMPRYEAFRALVPLHPVLKACVDSTRGWKCITDVASSALDALVLPVWSEETQKAVTSLVTARTEGDLTPQTSPLGTQRSVFKPHYKHDLVPWVQTLSAIALKGRSAVGSAPATMLWNAADMVISRNTIRPNSLSTVAGMLPWTRSIPSLPGQELNYRVPTFGWTDGLASSHDPWQTVFGLRPLVPVVQETMLPVDVVRIDEISTAANWSVFTVEPHRPVESMLAGLFLTRYMPKYGYLGGGGMKRNALEVLRAIIAQFHLGEDSTDARSALRRIVGPRLINGSVGQLTTTLTFPNIEVVLSNRTTTSLWLTEGNPSKIVNDLYTTSGFGSLIVAKSVGVGQTAIIPNEAQGTPFRKLSDVDDDQLRDVRIYVADTVDGTLPLTIALMQHPFADVMANKVLLLQQDLVMQWMPQSKLRRIASPDVPPVAKSISPIQSACSTIVSMPDTNRASGGII